MRAPARAASGTDAPTCKIGRVAGHDIAALGIWVQACKVPQICCDRRDMPGLRSLHRRVQLRYGAGRDIQRKAWGRGALCRASAGE